MTSKTFPVLVPAHLYAELRDAARQTSPQAELRPYDESETMPAGLNDAAAVLRWVAGQRFSRLVGAGPNIRWLHTASAGVDHILTPEVRAKAGLTVTDSGPAFEIAISEFVLAWMLLVARRLPNLMANQRAHRWQDVTQQELAGQTVGIIGLGPIGRGVAVRCQAFGMRTLGLRRSPSPSPGVEEILTGPEGLARLLSESDFVILAAALTGETKAILGAAQIAQMKPQAWLINIARGGLVDEAALIEACRHSQIGGACLDVFAQEPLPPGSPLWDMPNVYISPHNSPGGTAALHERQKTLFLDNLRRFTQGEPLQNVVDIARGY